MVPLMSLWIPILASAVLVFIASAIIHMLLTYHRSDIRGMPSESDVADAIRRSGATPGDYMIPYVGDPSKMKDPAFVEKMTRGPVVFLTVMPSRAPTMTPNLIQWFVYTIVVSIFAAYIAGRALTVGSAYLEVFRFTGASAFLGYSMALVQHSIWYGRQWSVTIKNVIDGLIYALLTAGVFGWLWPR